MTVVTSRFWDGTEYTDDQIAEVYANTLGSFVIPGRINTTKGDELKISTSTTAGNVTIQPGAAMVFGTYYETDVEVEVPITAALGFHVIVLRRDSTTNEVRPAVISSTATPPLISRPVETTDLALGLVRGETGVAISANDIRDFRQFFQAGFQREFSNYENMFDNVEFYGSSFGAGTAAPDGWKLLATPSISYTTSYDRGQWVRIADANANEGIRKVVAIEEHSEDGTLYTFTCNHYAQTNDGVLKIYKMTSGKTETLIRTVNLWNTTSSVPIVERIAVDDTYGALIFEFVTKNAGTVDAFYIANMGLFKGYLPVDPRWNSELIWYDYPIADANWNNTAYSTANNTVDLTTSFANCFAVGARGVVVRVTIKDSGSLAAASDATACLFYHIDQTPVTDPALVTVSCAGLPNDKTISKVVWIPIDPGSTTPSFIVRTVASGAGTLDVYMQIIGIIT